MKVAINAPQPCIAPTSDTVTVLLLKSTNKPVLVFLCPTRSTDYYMFIGHGCNSYLHVLDWATHVEQYYEYVGTRAINSMEVSFNA